VKKGKPKKLPGNMYRLYQEDIEPPTGVFTKQFYTGGGEYTEQRPSSLY